MIDKLLDQRIVAWVEENRRWILDNWMALARIPSVQGEAAEDAPFGVECARALAAAAKLFEDSGFDTRLEKSRGYALAQFGEGEKCIGIFGHSDVVPAGDGWAFTQPFEPIIQNGTLIGRGVCDNKNGVMASLCILRMAKELGLPLKSRLLAFVGSNEESGMGDIEAFVANEAMPDLSLVPDTAFPCALGEKGILRMWAKCGTKLSAVKDVRGGNAFNIVLDQVEAVLEVDDALLQELQAKCAESDAYRLETKADGIHLTAYGVAKHAASPDGSVNAAFLLAKLLSGCEKLPATDRMTFATVAAYLESYYGEGMGVAHNDSFCGKTTTVCGMVAVEDGHLKVSVDCRYGTEVEPAALERRFHTCWEEAGWSIVYLENRAGYRTAADSPVPGLLTGIVEELGGKERTCYFMPGGTYGRYLKNAFPTGTRSIATHREGPAMVMPAGSGGAHQRDECVDIEGFFLGLRILTHAVLACDKLIGE